MSRSQRARAPLPAVSRMAPASASREGVVDQDLGEAEQSERRHASRPTPQRRVKAAPEATNRASALWTTAYCVAIVLFLAYGLREVVERRLTPKDGLGYYIGIIGALMMLSLLLYPARKHYKWLQSLGSVASWFKAHMILGVLGPALIVVHSGFEMNSKNGTVAMITMLLVVASGVIGAYVYSRLHVGLYGRRAEINDLIKDIEKSEAALAIGSAMPVDVLRELRELADATLATTKSFAGSVRFRFSRRKRVELKRALHPEIEMATAAAALHRALTQPYCARNWTRPMPASTSTS